MAHSFLVSGLYTKSLRPQGLFTQKLTFWDFVLFSKLFLAPLCLPKIQILCETCQDRFIGLDAWATTNTEISLKPLSCVQGDPKQIFKPKLKISLYAITILSLNFL